MLTASSVSCFSCLLTWRVSFFMEEFKSHLSRTHLFQWCHDASVKDLKKKTTKKNICECYFGMVLVSFDRTETCWSMTWQNRLHHWFCCWCSGWSSWRSTSPPDMQWKRCKIRLTRVGCQCFLLWRFQTCIRGEEMRLESLFLISLNKVDEDACGRTSNSNLRRPFI